MNTPSLARSMIVALPLAAMGCLGAADESASIVSAAQAPDSGAMSPAADVAASTPAACPYLATERVTADAVRARLPVVNAPFEVEGGFQIAQEANGTCFFDSTLAGTGVRVQGEFRIPGAITVNTATVTTALVADPTGVEPYLFRAVIPVGTVAFESDGQVEMSTNCLRLRRALEGELRDLSITIDYAPPTGARTSYARRAVTVAYDRIRVRNPDAAIPAFSAVMLAVNALLNTAAERAVIEGEIANTLIAEGVPATLSALALTPAFYAASGLETDDVFCRVALGTCSGVPCAGYHVAQ